MGPDNHDNITKVGNVVEGVCSYLVLQVLAGNKHVPEVVHMYFVLNVSPSTISTHTGVPVGKVKGYINRIHEKTGGRYMKAREAIRLLYPCVIKLEPIINGNYCTACGRYINGNGIGRVTHVIHSHPDVLSGTVSEVIKGCIGGSVCTEQPKSIRYEMLCVKVPIDLKRKVEQMAREQGMSMSEYMRAVLASLHR